MVNAINMLLRKIGSWFKATDDGTWRDKRQPVDYSMFGVNESDDWQARWFK